MFLKYNKEAFLSNVSYKIKERGLRIGDVEKEAGLSVGYFSRMKNDNSCKSGPSIDSLVKISNILRVDLTLLVTTELDSLTESETTIYMFIRYLIKQTHEGKIKWMKKNTSNELLKQFPTQYQPIENLFRSTFTNEKYVPDKEFYIVNLSGKNMVFMKLYKPNGSFYHDDDHYEVSHRELYFMDTTLYNFAFAKDKDDSILSNYLKLLESNIHESLSKNHLDSKVVDFVNSILKSDE